MLFIKIRNFERLIIIRECIAERNELDMKKKIIAPSFATSLRRDGGINLQAAMFKTKVGFFKLKSNLIKFLISLFSDIFH